MVTDPEP